MAMYQDEDRAAADGLRIVHEPERNRYALYRDVEGADPRLVGEAHYTLLGDDAVNFDHTLVIPELRGTGISEVLARRALTGDAVGGRRILASCWFISGYLAKHPELQRS